MVLFDWTNENNEDLLLSFSKDEILLNEKASKYFFNYKWAMILIDDHNQRFAISPISKNQKDLNLFSNRQKYKLFLSKNKIKIKGNTNCVLIIYGGIANVIKNAIIAT